jgi:hypothetical protein
MDPNDAQIRKQREEFIRAFQNIAVATENLAAVSKKQIEIMNKLIDTSDGLAGTIMAPEDGLRDVLDELIAEIHGLREDMRKIAHVSGAQAVFAALTGRKR